MNPPLSLSRDDESQGGPTPSESNNGPDDPDSSSGQSIPLEHSDSHSELSDEETVAEECLAVHISTACADTDQGSSDEWPLATEVELTRLHEVMTQAAKGCGIYSGEIVVQIIDDAEMIRLHTEFCDLETTTDVLTFDMTPDGIEPDLGSNIAEDDMEKGQWSAFERRANPLGRRFVEVNLALCVDEAQRQADSRGHSRVQELILYAVHGLLHCLGHDDHDDEAYTLMHGIEDELLEHLGIGQTFHRPEQIE